MSKPLFGLILGGILGIFDGLTARIGNPKHFPPRSLHPRVAKRMLRTLAEDRFARVLGVSTAASANSGEIRPLVRSRARRR